MNKNKGFTVVTLIASLTILAILMILAVPKILDAIERADMNAYKDSVELMVHTAKLQYDNDNMLKPKEIPQDGIVYEYENNRQVNIEEVGELKFEGDKPLSGTITLLKNKKVIVSELVSKNGKWCAVKTQTGKVKVGSTKDDEFFCDAEDMQDEENGQTPGGGGNDGHDDYIEPDGEYLRYICEGTKTYDKNTLWKIQKVEDLVCLSVQVNSGTTFSGATVQMVSSINIKKKNNYAKSTTKFYGDINEDGTEDSIYNELNSGKSFKQIGTNNSYFQGTFNGDMFTLNNLVINRPEEDYVGLFGYTSGTIKKLKINNLSVTGKNYVGGIVGKLSHGIIQTIVTENIQTMGNSTVGGIIGHNVGTLDEIKFDTNVTGNNSVGGLVGFSGEVFANTGYIKNAVGRTVSTGSGVVASAVSGGYSEIRGLIIEGGSSNKAFGEGTSATCFYLDGYTYNGEEQGTIYDSSARSISGYESAIDTIIGGDNDGTGYYFRFDENNEIQLVSVEDYPIEFSLSGSGTTEDPYMINTAEEWNQATTKANLVGTVFKLGRDIDFTGKEFYKMGGPLNKFNGVLDGNNHTLSGITINGGSYEGVIGYMDTSAEVKDLTISNGKIVKGSKYNGMLTGYYNGNNKITNVKIPGTKIQSMGYTGGLIGYNSGTISNLELSGIEVKEEGLKNYNNTGGIVGYNYSVIKALKAENVKVIGNDNVGGIVGYNYNKVQTVDAKEIEIVGTNSVGGIVGTGGSGSSTTEILAEVKANGTTNVGGIIGYNTHNLSALGSTFSSVGNVVLRNIEITGNNYVGGVTGYNYGYDITGAIIESGTIVGSMIDGNQRYSHSYYLDGVQTTTEQGTIYDSSARSISGYESAIDTIIGGDNDGTGYYFKFDGNNEIQLVSVEDYPIEFSLSGSGTIEDPYMINTAEEWNQATTKANLVGTVFKLGRDIDFTGKEFYKMGGPLNKFNGVLDGNNHTLSGITINGGSYEGVIGYMDTSAEVKDLTISNGKIVKGSTYNGMLTGYYNGNNKITNVKIPGTKIQSMGYTGGLVGYNTGTISNLELSNIELIAGNLKKYDNIGGLVGYNYGTISDLELSGIEVKKEDSNNTNNTGGITGYNSGTIKKLKIGNIKVVGNNYVGGIEGCSYESRVETIDMIDKIEVTGNNNVGGVTGYQKNYRSQINEIKFNTKVTGNGYVGGIAGYHESSDNLKNMVGKTEVIGNSYVGGIVGYSTSTYNITSAIIESGSSSGYTFDGRNLSPTNTIYYLDGVQATTEQGTIYDSSARSISGYESAIDTIIGGDNDGTGYYFRFDENNEIQLVSVEDYPIEFSLSGSGTTEDPYMINTAEEWNQATTKANLVGTVFKLGRDIDFTGKEFYKMGGPLNKFNGVLDGNNHTLSGITINGGSYEGVIGYMDTSGEVKNLTISNGKIVKGSTYNGMLTGYYNGNNKITNVKIPGTKIQSMGYTGGLVGYNSGTISNLELSGIEVKEEGLKNYNNTGGITGYNSGTIKKLKIGNIKVVGNNYVGGIEGCSYESRVETIDMIDKIEVTGNNNVGGVTGYQKNYRSQINEIKFNTKVTGNGNVGGIAGYHESSDNLKNMVGKTEVTGNSYVGGIVGYSTSTYNITSAIIESGSSSGYDFDGRNLMTAAYGKIYYFDTYIANAYHGTKLDSTYYRDMTKYSEAIETSITGDVDGTGYYFDLNDTGTDIILKEVSE